MARDRGGTMDGLVDDPKPNFFTGDSATWQYTKTDWMWCPECRGFGFVKLSWYKGVMDGAYGWVPCGQCDARGCIDVKFCDRLEFAQYVPTWEREETPDWVLEMVFPIRTVALPPISERAPDCMPECVEPFPTRNMKARKLKTEEVWQRLIDGETVCFAPGVMDYCGLELLARTRKRKLVVEDGQYGVKRCYLEGTRH
jgi:hypothetical protein